MMVMMMMIKQKDEETEDDRGRDGGTNCILRIKEQETCLTLQEHDDDVSTSLFAFTLPVFIYVSRFPRRCQYTYLLLSLLL